MNTKQEVCKKIKEYNNNISYVEIQYYGSGDSFGDFFNLTASDKDNKNIKVNESIIIDFIYDYCCDIFNNSRYVDFNNDGCEGTITIDVDNETTKLDNYIIIKETKSTGEEIY